MKIKLDLTNEQAHKLTEMLAMKDEGPLGYGWPSKELNELVKIVDISIKKAKEDEQL